MARKPDSSRKHDSYTAAVLAAALIQCFDCSRNLENSVDWEPFIHGCACGCGETEHVRLCGPCIADIEACAADMCAADNGNLMQEEEICTQEYSAVAI